MQLRFDNLLPGETPIDTAAAYSAAREALDEQEQRRDAAAAELVRRQKAGERTDPELLREYDLAREKVMQILSSMHRRSPLVLIARCPYCDQPTWSGVPLWSLDSAFWYRTYSSGRDEVHRDRRCPHLFCVDGALNLNGRSPTTIRQPIQMAAEVPFVKPRVLNLPTMLAVVHSFPVAEKYTAYPVVYFVEQTPAQMDFCIGWARTEYFDSLQGGSGASMTAKRSDRQDFALENWVRRKKLFWLDPGTDDHPLVTGPPETFPYSSVSGRQHPFVIRKDGIIELPTARDERPTVSMEDPWGPRVIPPKGS